MTLDSKTFKQLSNQQLYDQLQPILNDIFNRYSYANISNDNYKKIVFSVINSIRNTNENENIIDSIKKNINKDINKDIRRRLNKPSEAYKIIDSYINLKFIVTTNTDDNLAYFEKLNTFLSTYDYLLTPDVLSNLIVNNIIFNKMTLNIFNKYKDLIIQGNIDLLDNPLLTSTIEVYCLDK